MPAVAHLTGPSREATVTMIGRLAAIGRSDPDISSILRGSVTPAEVRALRREYNIPAGERTWLGRDTS